MRNLGPVMNVETALDTSFTREFAFDGPFEWQRRKAEHKHAEYAECVRLAVVTTASVGAMETR